jgi:hypothetical protein
MAQMGLELNIVLPPPLEFSDYRYVSSHHSKLGSFEES